MTEATTPMPNDVEGFLKNSENKLNLNLMIAKHAVHPLRSGNNKVVITYKELKVLTSNDGPKKISDCLPESHEGLTVGSSLITKT